MTKRKCDSTEEDRMKRLIICKLCDETLEDPLILPCGKKICSKHLLDETNLFKCNLCDNAHDKTVDKFPVNQTVNELLQICDDYVDLGQEQLIESIEQKYEQIINEIKEIETKCKQNAQNKEPVQTIEASKPRLSVWIEKF